MTLDRRARWAVRTLEAETADVDPIAALNQILRRQRRVVRLQFAAAVALIVVVLTGAFLFRRGTGPSELPVAPPSSTVAPAVNTFPRSSAPAQTGYPIPLGPPFPRAAASAFPRLFDSPKVRQLRETSQHPVAFPTWLPGRVGWALSSTQVLGKLTDYRLRPSGNSQLEIEVFHSQVGDGRSTDPLDAPVRGLTMPNGLKVYVYKDMTSGSTEAYIISDRREFVVVYFFNCDPDLPGRPGKCLTTQERWRFLRGLALISSGK